MIYVRLVRCPCGTNSRPSPKTNIFVCNCGRTYQAKIDYIHRFEYDADLSDIEYSRISKDESASLE